MDRFSEISDRSEENEFFFVDCWLWPWFVDNALFWRVNPYEISVKKNGYRSDANLKIKNTDWRL